MNSWGVRYSARHLRLCGRAHVGGGCADKCLCRDDNSMQAIYGRHVATRSVLLGKLAAPATALTLLGHKGQVVQVEE